MNEKNKKESATERLLKKLEDGNFRLTFDQFRDSTKGCKRSCPGWEGGGDWCDEHLFALKCGLYCVSHKDIPSKSCLNCQDIPARLEWLKKRFS